jgi:hypothetical protein
MNFEDLLVVGTRCFKFPTQALARHGGKGTTQENILKKAGLFFNFYKNFLVAMKNSNTWRLTIISNTKCSNSLIAWSNLPDYTVTQNPKESYWN